jgi:hypothetical protein
VRCLAEKIERCLTFNDFAQADWSKIRTNNVAERPSGSCASDSARWER